MPTPQPNYLIAEDGDLQFAIAELMKTHIPNWGTSPLDWKVEIKRARGVNDALNHDTLFEYMKAGGLKVLGVAVDADDKFQARWESLKDFCAKCNATLPAACPTDGLIVDRLVGTSGIEIRFGAWFMPDNSSDGMVENLCLGMVPLANDMLLAHAESSATRARELGAPFNPIHDAKAKLHSWLSWQNPPGQSIGKAIASGTLSPDAACTNAFVSWFRKLYSL